MSSSIVRNDKTKEKSQISYRQMSQQISLTVAQLINLYIFYTGTNHALTQTNIDRNLWNHKS